MRRARHRLRRDERVGKFNIRRDISPGFPRPIVFSDKFQRSRPRHPGFGNFDPIWDDELHVCGNRSKGYAVTGGGRAPTQTRRQTRKVVRTSRPFADETSALRVIN